VDLEPISPAPVSDDSIPPESADQALTEDQALAWLKQNDLAAETISQISMNAGAAKSRKVKLAIVEHPKTPRRVSLRLLRELFTFDLMQVALAVTTPGDVKRAAEDSMLGRLEAISFGERASLARRASGRIAAQLLLDSEPRVIRAALANARLTETLLVRALTRPAAPAALAQAVCGDAKWSCRREVRIALLRNEHTPLARALEYARALPVAVVREVLQASRLPAELREHLRRGLQRR